MERRAFLQTVVAAVAVTHDLPRPLRAEPAEIPAALEPGNLRGTVVVTDQDGQEYRAPILLTAIPDPQRKALIVTGPRVVIPTPLDRSVTLTKFRGEIPIFAPGYPPIPIRFDAPVCTINPGDQCMLQWPVTRLDVT